MKITTLIIFSIIFVSVYSDACDDCRSSFTPCCGDEHIQEIFCGCLQILSECYSANNCPEKLQNSTQLLCQLTGCEWCGSHCVRMFY